MWSALGSTYSRGAPATPDPELWDHRTGRPARRPTLAQIGKVGAKVIGPELTWLRRHVETVTLQTLTSARRQLTIDVDLPVELDSSFAWRDGERMCYLPVALLLKHPPSSNLDMLDEQGRSLPVLNRLENAEITHAAMMSVLADMYGQELADDVQPFVREAIFAVDRDSAKVHVMFAITRMIESHPGAQTHPDWKWLARFLVTLSAHSLNWLGLAGLPGERRVVKFVYDILVDIPKPFRRRARWVGRAARAEGERGRYIVYYVDWDPGDGYPHGFLTRMVKRFVTVMGGSAYHVPIQTPYIRNTPSYHLQVNAPEGLETRRVELLARLNKADGKPAEPVDATTPDCAHLYFSEARVTRMGTAIVSVRVGRRGLLSYAVIACIVIATMLWEFAAHSATISGSTEKAAAAAILLLVPTLMLVFAIRPGEHLLATKMLSGVRAVLALQGLLCVAAAGALVGIDPFHETVHTLWRWAAEVATIAGVLLAACWAFSFSILEPVRARLRSLLASYWAFAGCALALVLVLWLWLSHTAHTANLTRVRDYVDWIGLGLLGVLAAWIALFFKSVAHPTNSRMVGQLLLFAGGLCVVAAARRATVGHGLAAWSDIRAVTWWALPATGVSILALVVLHLLDLPRAERTVDDEDLFFIGPAGVAAAPDGDAAG